MWQLFTIFVLFGLMAGLSLFLPGGQDLQLVAPTGFVLLAAFAVGELFKRVNMPALLGYIAAGFLFGPDLIGLVLPPDAQFQLLPDKIAKGRLAYVEILTVGVIGTLGGGELDFDDLRGQLGTIIKVTALFFLSVVPLTAAVVYALPSIAPSLIPFVSPEAPTSVRLSVALLFGVFGFAMSPAATLAIIQETKSEGRFTSLVLGVVIVADLVLVASYLLTQSFASILIQEFSDKALDAGAIAGALAGELPGIGAEFMWALIVGAVAGLIFILYFRFVAREMIFFTVGVIFVTYYVCDQLHAEKLLAFITAGFMVQNLSRYGHDMIEALERISLPVFVIYFTLKAASLDIQKIGEFAALTGVLTLARTGALWAALRYVLPKIDDLQNIERDNLWLSFFPRGGVDLVLAGLLANQVGVMGPWVQDFEAVIMAVVVVHIIAGPPILSFVLRRTGQASTNEPDDSPETTEPDESEASFDLDFDPDRFDEVLPRPDVEDEALQRHLERLRTSFDALHREHLVDPIRDYNARAEAALGDLDGHLRASLDELETLLEADDDRSLQELARDVRACHKQMRQTIEPDLERIGRLPPAALSRETMETFMDSLRDLERFESSRRVEWGRDLVEIQPDDGLLSRLTKPIRSLYIRLLGTGYRSVPIGRLWRYFVELALPIALERHVQSAQSDLEAFWFQLLRHLRSVDRLFQTIIERLRVAREGEPIDGTDDASDEQDEGQTYSPPLLTIPLASDLEEVPYLDVEAPDLSAQRPESSDVPADDILVTDETIPLEELPEDVVDTSREQLDAFRDDFDQRADEIERRLASSSGRLLECSTREIEGVFDDFLEGVTYAGSIHLPRFRYRPSKRFDAAQQAEELIQEQLESSHRFAQGCRGWIQLDQELVLFLDWFHDHLDQISRTLDRHLRERCLHSLRELEEACRKPLDGHSLDAVDEGESIDWSNWYDTHLEPRLARVREAFSETLDELSEGNVTQELLELLETRVMSFSGSLALLEDVPDELPADPSSIGVTDLPVRRWYMAEFIRETALRFVEFNEHAERPLRRSLVTLEDIENSLEVDFKQQGAHDAPADALPEAHELGDELRRDADRVAELCDAFERDERELQRWIQVELLRSASIASEPLLRGKLDTLVERFTQEPSAPQRKEAAPISRWFQSLQDRLDHTLDRSVSQFRTFTTDLQTLLTEEERSPTRDDVRDRLRAGSTMSQSDIPAIYRRLFTPVPVDIPDFYIERPEVEQACLDVIDEWIDGAPNSMLIYSDEGMGKHTLLYHLLPVQLFETFEQLSREQVHHIHFGERPESEAELCRELEGLTHDSSPETFAGLTRRIHGNNDRHVVFIEDGDRLYMRTPEGMERCRRFLDFMARTSDDILWIVMLDQPMATFLETSLDLFDHFTHTLQFPELGTEEIEEMISLRHRVSGFHLEFEPPETRVVDRLRHPIAASEASRRPRQAFFERLGRLSNGNPMLALLYWLRSVRPDPEDDTRFRVQPLPKEEISLVAPLSLKQQLLLAAIVQHKSLRLDRMARVVDMGLSELRNELTHLMRLGFVESTRGQLEHYKLRPFAAPLVTRELRELNML